jgi:hypothetical protein
VRDPFQTGEPKETAGPLDGVHQPEDVIQDGGVVRLLLELDEFNVNNIETFAGLGQKFSEEVVHGLHSPDGYWFRAPKDGWTGMSMGERLASNS